MVKQPEESVLDFSKRVQHTMAKAMGLIPTVYTSSDKFELIKQLRISTASTGIIYIHRSWTYCLNFSKYTKI